MRRQQDAHDGRAEDEVVDVDVDQLERERVARDDEAELADLGHGATEEKGGAHRHPEPPPEDGDDEALAGDRNHDEERDERCRRKERFGIDEHPDRHEEQDREQVAERDDLGGGLVGDVRLRDDDPGDERAERQR